MIEGKCDDCGEVHKLPTMEEKVICFQVMRKRVIANLDVIAFAFENGDPRLATEAVADINMLSESQDMVMPGEKVMHGPGIMMLSVLFGPKQIEEVILKMAYEEVGLLGMTGVASADHMRWVEAMERAGYQWDEGMKAGGE